MAAVALPAQSIGEVRDKRTFSDSSLDDTVRSWQAAACQNLASLQQPDTLANATAGWRSSMSGPSVPRSPPLAIEVEQRHRQTSGGRPMSDGPSGNTRSASQGSPISRHSPRRPLTNAQYNSRPQTFNTSGEIQDVGDPETAACCHSRNGSPSAGQQRAALFSHRNKASETRSVPAQELRRVHFAPGPWQDKYGTPDGHPGHEGLVARPQRACLPRYPVSITAANVHALEAELEDCCPWSVDRLKRRVGLLPIVRRPKPFITAPQERLPRLCVRTRAQQAAALEAESDADSDSSLTPPTLSCRRRKLFPLTAEEAASAAKKAQGNAEALYAGGCEHKHTRQSGPSKRTKHVDTRQHDSDSYSFPQAPCSTAAAPSSPSCPASTEGSHESSADSTSTEAQQQQQRTVPVRHRRTQRYPDECCTVPVLMTAQPPALSPLFARQ